MLWFLNLCSSFNKEKTSRTKIGQDMAVGSLIVKSLVDFECVGRGKDPLP